MSIKVVPSHVAVLVPSVQRAADSLRTLGFHIGEAESFEGEGTREIYVEVAQPNSLLLMEAAGPGPYRRALEKRGPGLHHLAVDVLDLEAYLEWIAGSGWLMHPASVKTIKAHRTVYLARPGLPALIEVQERKELRETAPFVDGITLAMDANLSGLLKFIGLEAIAHAGTATEFSLRGRRVPLSQLF